MAIRVIVVALLGYAALNVWYGFREGSIAFALWVVPSALCALGLAFGRAWSRYLRYLVSAFTFMGWLVFTLIAWPYCELQQQFQLMTLGVAISAFATWSIRVVRQHLGNSSTEPNGVAS